MMAQFFKHLNLGSTFLVLFITSACCLFAACVTSQGMYPIVVSKELCYGTCPKFSVTLYANGTIDFEGEAYTKFEGKTSKQLTRSEKIKLIDAFNRINLHELKDVYDRRVYDLPQTTLQYGDKKVVFKRLHLVPVELKTFIQLMDSTLREEGLLL